MNKGCNSKTMAKGGGQPPGTRVHQTILHAFSFQVKFQVGCIFIPVSLQVYPRLDISALVACTAEGSRESGCSWFQGFSEKVFFKLTWFFITAEGQTNTQDHFSRNNREVMPPTAVYSGSSRIPSPVSNRRDHNLPKESVKLGIRHTKLPIRTHISLLHQLCGAKVLHMWVDDCVSFGRTRKGSLMMDGSSKWSQVKVGQPWITNLQVMWTDGWVMPNCTQNSQKSLYQTAFSTR